jgi:hypothetical protein
MASFVGVSLRKRLQDQLQLKACQIGSFGTAPCMKLLVKSKTVSTMVVELQNMVPIGFSSSIYS